MTKIIESRRLFEEVAIGPDTTLTDGTNEGYRRLRDGLFEQMQAVKEASDDPIEAGDVRIT